MEKYNKEAVRMCDKLDCQAAATHEYYWIGRPVAVCTQHMEEAVELAKSIGYFDTVETVRSLRPDEKVKTKGYATGGVVEPGAGFLLHENYHNDLIIPCKDSKLVPNMPDEPDVEDYWGE